MSAHVERDTAFYHRLAERLAGIAGVTYQQQPDAYRYARELSDLVTERKNADRKRRHDEAWRIYHERPFGNVPRLELLHGREQFDLHCHDLEWDIREERWRAIEAAERTPNPDPDTSGYEDRRDHPELYTTPEEVQTW